MIGDCLKQKNKAVTGEIQPPSHPSNDSSVPTINSSTETRINYWENYAYKLTSSIEGSGINQVSDNFDGQGISLGGLQWCAGQGSLQSKILKPYFFSNTPKNSVEQTLLEISRVSVSDGLSLCKKNFLTGTKIKSEVFPYLQSFIVNAEKFQMLAAREIFDYAWSMAKSNNMETLKSFCFFFDIGVQNGTMKNITKPNPDISLYNSFINNEGGVNKELWKSLPKIDTETIILCLWIKERASNNQWREDVLARKCTIAHGVGIIHGDKYIFPEFNQSV